MTEVAELIARIRATPDCRLSSSRGLPDIREADQLPRDLVEFYENCGGVRLFEASDYPVRIVGPEAFVRANPEIVGSECPDDISDFWYIVAGGGREEAISIDCSPERLGRCYDSFWDRHGVAGDCAVVALSFTELLKKLLVNRGGYWYWLKDGGTGNGDAYGDSVHR